MMRRARYKIIKMIARVIFFTLRASHESTSLEDKFKCRGMFFNVNYIYIEEKFGHGCTGQASANQFTLDGYLTGSGFFAPGDITVFLNDEAIYQATSPSTHLFSFDAVVGDRMRILVDNVSANGTLDVICMITPSGQPVRLTHYAEVSTGSTFDVTYEIREN